MSERGLRAIDEAIDVERHILEYDRRGGHHCPDAKATWARIDRLLDERNELTQRTQPTEVAPS